MGGCMFVVIYDLFVFVLLNVGLIVVQVYYDVSGDQYVNMWIGMVVSLGGMFDVLIGNVVNVFVVIGNVMMIVVKQSDFIYVDGMGLVLSVINWNLCNQIWFIIGDYFVSGGFVGSIQFDVLIYVGIFIVFDGSMWIVIDVVLFVVYNDFFVCLVCNGVFGLQIVYDNVFGQVVMFFLQIFEYVNNVLFGDKNVLF